MKFLSTRLLALSLVMLFARTSTAQFQFIEEIDIGIGGTYVDITFDGLEWHTVKFDGSVDTFDSSFNHLRTTTFPSPFFGNGRSMWIDRANGNYLYLSATTRRLTEYTPNLDLVHNYPTNDDGLGVTGAVLDPDTNVVWTAGTFNNRVRSFSRDGTPLAEFQTSAGEFNGMSIDLVNRTLLLSDPAPDRILEYTLDGQFVGLAFEGSLMNGFSNGIYYDSDTARLYSINRDGVVAVWEDLSRLDLEEELTPSDVVVTRGQFVSGGATELSASDNSDLVVRRSPGDIQSVTEFELGAVSTNVAPTTMSVTLETSVFARSNVDKTIELFDYNNSVWEEVDTRSASRFGDVSITVDVTGDVSRFVDAATGEVRARIRYQSAAMRQSFSSNTDFFMWTIN